MQVKVIFTIKIASLVLCYLFVDEVYTDTMVVADFETTVKSYVYIDKTQLIHHFMERPKVKVVTAPSRSGKSTVLSMIKSFLNIPDDLNCTRVPLKTTQAYTAFCQPKLNICKNEKFVKTHMGQYPVIHIELQPLEEIQNFDTLVTQFQNIVFNSFLPYFCLKYNSTLWKNENERNCFLKYVNMNLIAKLTGTDVFASFTFLCEILHRNFGRKVVVLLDDYDAFFRKQLFGNLDNELQLMNFTLNLFRSLFVGNVHLKRAMIVGVVRIKDVVDSCQSSGRNVRQYDWLGDHELSSYYSLTKKEILDYTRQIVQNETMVNDVFEILDKKYNGYRISNRNYTTYGLWSVLGFFSSETEPVTFWKESVCFSYLILESMVNDKNRNKIIALVTRGVTSLAARVSCPLNITDVINMHKYVLTDDDTNMERFYLLCYDLGFLKTTRDHHTDPLTPLVIPNLEMYVEFGRALIRYGSVKWKLSSHYLPYKYSVIDLFEPVNNSNTNYDLLFNTTRYIINNCKINKITKDDFKTLICLYIASDRPDGVLCTVNFPITTSLNGTTENIPAPLKDFAHTFLQSHGRKFKTKIDIAIGNQQQMAIVMKTKFLKGKIKHLKHKLKKMARECLCQAILTYEPYLNERPLQFFKSRMKPKGVIYVGFAFNAYTKHLSMAFYYPPYDKWYTLING